MSHCSRSEEIKEMVNRASARARRRTDAKINYKK
jgi:hypothetical protein